jgi:hypothetical protein
MVRPVERVRSSAEDHRTTTGPGTRTRSGRQGHLASGHRPAVVRRWMDALALPCGAGRPHTYPERGHALESGQGPFRISLERPLTALSLCRADSVLAQDIPDRCLTTCRTDVAGHAGRAAEVRTCRKPGWSSRRSRWRAGLVVVDLGVGDRAVVFEGGLHEGGADPRVVVPAAGLVRGGRAVAPALDAAYQRQPPPTGMLPSFLTSTMPSSWSTRSRWSGARRMRGPVRGLERGLRRRVAGQRRPNSDHEQSTLCWSGTRKPLPGPAPRAAQPT